MNKLLTYIAIPSISGCTRKSIRAGPTSARPLVRACFATERMCLRSIKVFRTYLTNLGCEELSY